MQQSPTRPVRRILIHRHPDLERGLGAIEFGVSSPRGAVSFAVQVGGLFLPDEQAGLRRQDPTNDGINPLISQFVDRLRRTPRRNGHTIPPGPDYAVASCVAYHSPNPGDYDDQEPQEGCDFLDGQPCYGDASFLRGEWALEHLALDGAAGLLDWLEADYRSRYGAEGSDD